MNQRLFLLASWSVLAFIAFATLCPLDERPVVAGPQVEHFAAFALLGFAFARGYPTRTLLSVAIVTGSAFALEALQLLTPDRDGRLLDALVKAAGGIFGIAVARLALPLLWQLADKPQIVRARRRVGHVDRLGGSHPGRRDVETPHHDGDVQANPSCSQENE
jgi:VanZ family protein